MPRSEPREQRTGSERYLHGGDGVHVGAGGGGAADAAGLLVEAEDELRGLVEDVVVLLHEGVAHLEDEDRTRIGSGQIESARQRTDREAGRVASLPLAPAASVLAPRRGQIGRAHV